MPRFTIRTINSHFNAEGTIEKPSPEQAFASGVAGALTIAAEEIRRGKAAAAVEVSVEVESGEVLLRSALTISLAPLATKRAAPSPLPQPTNDI